MEFEYYAVVTERGFRQCGASGSPSLYKNKRTAERVARYWTQGGRKAAVVTFRAKAVAAAPPGSAGDTNHSHFLAIKNEFPGAL
jgi:hypothetical protein